MGNPNRFYTYAYLREDGTPYYIGKGTRDRIYSKTRSVNLPKDKSRIIFLKQNLTEEDAFKHEIYMIAVFGRKDLGTGILRNKTDGGDGVSGFFHSEETKQKLSELNKGKIISDETRRKMCAANRGESNPNYGKKHSEEAKRKISEAQKGEKNHNYGKNHSDETKRKQSEALRGEKSYWYGKNLTEETKRKLSELNKGKTISNETRIKISEANKGKKGYWKDKCHSKETRKKMSEARMGENNPAYGRKWWNDGNGNIKYVKECPGEGWVLGKGKSLSEKTRRKISAAQIGKSVSLETRKKISEAHKSISKGSKWWNDGNGNTRFTKECPGEGWFPGRGKRKVI